jgi:hypothetical protein
LFLTWQGSEEWSRHKESNFQNEIRSTAGRMTETQNPKLGRKKSFEGLAI